MSKAYTDAIQHGFGNLTYSLSFTCSLPEYLFGETLYWKGNWERRPASYGVMDWPLSVAILVKLTDWGGRSDIWILFWFPQTPYLWASWVESSRRRNHPERARERDDTQWCHGIFPPQSRLTHLSNNSRMCCHGYPSKGIVLSRRDVGLFIHRDISKSTRMGLLPDFPTCAMGMMSDSTALDKSNWRPGEVSGDRNPISPRLCLVGWECQNMTFYDFVWKSTSPPY